MLYVTWDPHKAAANVRKHGVRFETAQQVFADDYAIYEHDRIEQGEVRWSTIGAVKDSTLVVVAHTWDDEVGDQYVRIISARPAKPQERRNYDRSRFGLA